MSKFTADIATFCDAARRGASPAASTGEQIAHRLARALHDVGDDMMLLDQECIEGFSSLCRLAAGPFHTDDQKTIVFDTIRKACGL
jgi:hypothetical protein